MNNEIENSEVWNPENLNFYLNVYYSDLPDWNRELVKLQAKGRPKDANRRQLGFTILSSTLGIRPTTPIEALLFVCFKYDSFNDQDWAFELEKIYNQDQVIKQNRQLLLSMGVIAPIEYHARSRQAYKWVLEEASRDSSITKENKSDVLNRLKSSIMIYGPSSICSLFQRVELKAALGSTTTNWRTGYFIERSLYKFYDFEKLQQFKQRDIESAPIELIKNFSDPQNIQNSN